MNAQDCMNKIREIKDVAFATVDENGKPQVRIIDVMIVEDEKLYFCTARGKDFYRQLMADGSAAITGLNKDFQVIRISGKAEKLDDQKAWIDRIFKENPSMNDVYPGDSRYILDPFCISSGEIEFFDLGISPNARETFTFGGSDCKEKGFFITDSCITCGKCKKNCPQQCIDKGTPFKIQQEHCVHCGLCFENCPVQAIVRRGE